MRLFLRAPIIVFGAIFMAYRLSPELTFWFLVMVAILSFVIVVLSRLVNPLYSILRKKTDQLVQETRQQIQGMRVIRAFGQEKREIENFQVLNQVYTAIQMKTGYWSSLLTPLNLFDRQWNFAGDYLEWLYFYPGRLAQSGCLDCLNQLSPANLGRVDKTSHAHQFTQPVLYFCQAN